VLFALGFILNAVVMAANHSQMPVQMPGGMVLDSEDIVHCTMTSATHLKFLADWIVINGQGIASPGDFFIWAGEYLQIPLFWAWLALIVSDSNL